MKINLTDEVTKNTLLSHIILNCMTHAALESLPRIKDKGVFANIKLLVNDEEIDLKIFLDVWQEQVGRMIKDTAKEIAEERCSNIFNLLSDLEERLKSEIDQRLEDWEKEFNKHE